jgi:general nucleoside transport system permease protein
MRAALVWLAVVLAVLAAAVGQFGLLAAVSIVGVTIAKATPLTLGALAGLVCERSGVINIGIEGLMLTAAFFGFLVGVYTHSLGVALLGAVLSSVLLVALHAALSITFRVDQIISGTVVNILAVGLTGYLNRQLFATGAPAGQASLPTLPLPVLGDLPVVGPIVFQQKPITLAAIVLVFVVQWALVRTRWGLRTRAVGEHPLAADTVGIDVNRLRYVNVLLSGVLAGLGGAYFTLEAVPHFEPLMTNGAGFIALAAMIFGKWTPLGAWGAALLFGVAQAIPAAFQLQGVSIPFQLVGLLPYLLTIVVVAGAVGRAIPPAAIGVAYQRQ